MIAIVAIVVLCFALYLQVDDLLTKESLSISLYSSSDMNFGSIRKGRAKPVGIVAFTSFNSESLGNLALGLLSQGYYVLVACWDEKDYISALQKNGVDKPIKGLEGFFWKEQIKAHGAHTGLYDPVYISALIHGRVKVLTRELKLPFLGVVIDGGDLLYQAHNSIVTAHNNPKTYNLNEELRKSTVRAVDIITKAALDEFKEAAIHNPNMQYEPFMIYFNPAMLFTPKEREHHGNSLEEPAVSAYFREVFSSLSQLDGSVIDGYRMASRGMYDIMYSLLSGFKNWGNRAHSRVLIVHDTGFVLNEDWNKQIDLFLNLKLQSEIVEPGWGLEKEGDDAFTKASLKAFMYMRELYVKYHRKMLDWIESYYESESEFCYSDEYGGKGTCDKRNKKVLPTVRNALKFTSLEKSDRAQTFETDAIIIPCIILGKLGSLLGNSEGEWARSTCAEIWYSAMIVPVVEDVSTMWDLRPYVDKGSHYDYLVYYSRRTSLSTHYEWRIQHSGLAVMDRLWALQFDEALRKFAVVSSFMTPTVPEYCKYFGSSEWFCGENAPEKPNIGEEVAQIIARKRKLADVVRREEEKRNRTYNPYDK